MDPNIVVLAAGNASRMRTSLDSTATSDEQLIIDAREKAKAMIGIGAGSRPFLDYLLRNIVGAGYRHLILVVGERDSSIREYYEVRGGKKQFPELDFRFAIQPIPEGRNKPLGTADALLRALHAQPAWKEQGFTVCNSDNLYSTTSLRLLLENVHPNSMIDYDRAALGYTTGRIAQFSVLKKDAESFLEDITEKPTEEQIRASADSAGRIGVSMNLFRFSGRDILPFLESVPLHPVRDEKELPAAVKMMVRSRPRSLLTIPRSEVVPDLTSAADFESVQAFLNRNHPDMP